MTIRQRTFSITLPSGLIFHGYTAGSDTQYCGPHSADDLTHGAADSDHLHVLVHGHVGYKCEVCFPDGAKSADPALFHRDMTAYVRGIAE